MHMFLIKSAHHTHKNPNMVAGNGVVSTLRKRVMIFNLKSALHTL